jgi:hypothetical protein
MPNDSTDRAEAGEALTEKQIGQMFHVPWSPNPHRLEFVRPCYCQLHGEFIGMEAGLVKRRNSELRPWGSAIHIVAADDPRIAAIARSQL